MMKKAYDAMMKLMGPILVIATIIGYVLAIDTREAAYVLVPLGALVALFTVTYLVFRTDEDSETSH